MQGVGFRWFVLKRATDLGVVGWVKNNADGGVEVLASGDSGQLVALEESLNKGPLMSRVDAVIDVSKQHDIVRLKTFDII